MYQDTIIDTTIQGNHRTAKDPQGATYLAPPGNHFIQPRTGKLASGPSREEPLTYIYKIKLDALSRKLKMQPFLKESRLGARSVFF